MTESTQQIVAGVSVLATIINIVLGIFNIYLFVQNRKERRLRLDRDIKIKESDLEALRQRHHQEHEELEGSYEGEIRIRESLRVDFRTDNDRRREAKLFEKQRIEEERIWAELTHLYEMKDGRSFLLQPESKIKGFFKNICQRVRGALNW